MNDPNEKTPMIITSKQTPLQLPTASFEHDCACPSSSQLAAATFTPEHDCAPITHNGNQPDANRATVSLSSYYQTANDLYLTAINQQYHLAFNPLRDTGVVLLNQPLVDLLIFFEQPHHLSDAAANFNNLPLDSLSTLKYLVQLGLLQPVGYMAKPPTNTTSTLTAWLHITNDCNLDCAYCYVSKSDEAMTLETGKKAVDAVFRSALQNGFAGVKLKYAGGEATLNFPLIIHLHQYARDLARQHNLHLDGVVLTNGINMTHRMIDALQENSLRVMISLDGVADSHDAQRAFFNGRGSFQQVERGLDRLTARGLTPSISVTVSQRNLDGLSQTVEYLLQRQLPFTINFFRDNDQAAIYTDLAFQDEKIITAMKKAFVVIENNLPLYSLLGVLTDRARLDMMHTQPCGVGSSYLVINHRGEITKCHMQTTAHVTDVDAPDPLQIIRLDHTGLQNPLVDDKEGCRDCHWRYWCAGGCPALTYRVTGRYDVKSPNCRIYQAIFPEVLRLEGMRLLKYGVVSAVH